MIKDNTVILVNNVAFTRVDRSFIVPSEYNAEQTLHQINSISHLSLLLLISWEIFHSIPSFVVETDDLLQSYTLCFSELGLSMV